MEIESPSGQSNDSHGLHELDPSLSQQQPRRLHWILQHRLRAEDGIGVYCLYFFVFREPFAGVGCARSRQLVGGQEESHIGGRANVRELTGWTKKETQGTKQFRSERCLLTIGFDK